jgi:hypothetical protein
MVNGELKNIFLSASIPIKERHPKYFETSDVIAIRDSVIALTTSVLLEHRMIWGGHPSITPLIINVMEQVERNKLAEKEGWGFFTEEERKDKIEKALKSEVQNHVNLYQSEFFRNMFPLDNEKFENITFTENLGDVHSSIQHMRMRMLSENKFSAAVFIGGMDGIEVEYKMFKEYHPEALIIPIASTGAATKIVYDSIFPEDMKNTRFEKDYGYMSLFQKFLMDKI